MPRIRSIHPGLYTDEDFMALSPYAMVAWPGLWVEADDQGVFEWKPLTLKARLLPCAQVDMLELLAEYEARKMVVRFTVDGKDYGAVRNFRKFQRPEKPKSWHPLPDALRTYVGLSPTNPRPIPDPSPNGSGNPPQMEEGGGERRAANAAAAGAGARPLPSKSRFDEVETTCRDALGKLAPIDLVIGPVVQLADERGLEAVLPAMIDAARSSRSPIRTWALLAVKARERLDAPPITTVTPITNANGASHGSHRKPTVSDVLRARLAQLEPNDGEPPLLAIGCH